MACHPEHLYARVCFSDLCVTLLSSTPQRRWGLLLCCCGHGELWLVDSAKLGFCWEVGQFVQQRAQQPFSACVFLFQWKGKLCQIWTRSFRYVICKQSFFSQPVKNGGTYPPWSLVDETHSPGGFTAMLSLCVRVYVCVCLSMCENMQLSRVCVCVKNLSAII